MSEQEKKRQRIYYLLNATTKPKLLSILHIKQRKIFLLIKSFLRKKREWEIEQKNEKNAF